MVPTADHILELTELYLLESEGAGWPHQHALATIQTHGMTAVAAGGGGPRATRASRQSVALLADHSRAGRTAERMLDVIASVDPRLRRALEIRALGGTCETIGKRLGVTRHRASAILEAAVTAGQVYLVTR